MYISDDSRDKWRSGGTHEIIAFADIKEANTLEVAIVELSVVGADVEGLRAMSVPS